MNSIVKKEKGKGSRERKKGKGREKEKGKGRKGKEREKENQNVTMEKKLIISHFDMRTRKNYTGVHNMHPAQNLNFQINIIIIMRLNNFMPEICPN